MENFNELANTALPILIKYGMKVLGALVILILGWGAANWFSQKARKAAERSSKVDETLTPILSSTTKIIILIVTILAVLNQFGVATTSIIALLGAAGLAIGLALQGTLSNIASGIMLLVLRPFKVGDAVDIGGTVGVIDEIGLFVTHMHTFDNIGVVMPNSQAWGGQIKNFSSNDNRRLDMIIGIGYDDDMDKAISIIKDVLSNESRVLDEPEPLIAIGELGDSAVNIYVRPWTRKEDLWPTRFDLTKRIKERFDTEGVSFPFPQRDVHFFKEE